MYHTLLLNQLNKCGIDVSEMAPADRVKMNDFLTKVSNFYHEQDTARKRLTNSLRVSSQEMDKLYKELEENTKKIIFESKMLTLGEMAAGVAHEVNNPLMIMLSSLELFREKFEAMDILDPEYQAMLENMEKSIERIRIIVRGLKTLSRNDKNDNFSDFLICEIIKDSLSLCEEKIKNEGITLKITPCGEKMKVHCLPSQITQVIVNLLNNSRDAISHLSEKWIHIEVSKEEVVGVAGSFNLVIRITDSGSGIPMEIQEKLFNPFFTTKEVGKGTGLGLSISKGIITNHNGQLVINNDCKNTQFVLTLPLVKAVSASAAA